MPRPLACVPAVLVFLALPAAAAELEWYQIDRGVVDALATRDVGQWANELAAAPADRADAAEWVLLDLLIRPICLATCSVAVVMSLLARDCSAIACATWPDCFFMLSTAFVI